MTSARKKMDVQFLVHAGPDTRRPTGSTRLSRAAGTRPPSSIRCELCDKTYSLPGNLNKHVRRDPLTCCRFCVPHYRDLTRL